MKKRFIYSFVFLLFIVASGFIILKYKKEADKKNSELFVLLPGKGNAAQNAEWNVAKKLSASLIEKINVNPNDVKLLNSLTAIYLQEARTSGNFAYYDNAALNCVNRVLKIDAKNF